MLSVCTTNRHSSGSNCDTMINDLLLSLKPTGLQCILQTRQRMYLHVLAGIYIIVFTLLAYIHHIYIDVVLHKIGVLSNGQLTSYPILLY